MSRFQVMLKSLSKRFSKEKASVVELTCFDVPDPAEGAQILRECSVRMAGKTRHARFFRARVDGGGRAEKWAVHEVWMRGERKQI